MSEYKEIFRLKEMLDKANIEYEFRDRNIYLPPYEHYQICCPNCENRYISVVEGFGTYGESADKLEIMGLLTEEESEDDCVKGWLTAENVFNRIKKHLNKE